MITDAFLLLSIVNTALRDKYDSLSDYCLSEGVSEEEIVITLKNIGYYYDSDNNCFNQIDKSC